MINIPFTDYASMKPQRMPLADLISDYMEGREYRQRLKMMPEDLIKAKQANEHQALINKWYEPNIQSEIGFRGAQTGKLNKDIEWYDRDMSSTIASRAAEAAYKEGMLKYLPDEIKAKMAEADARRVAAEAARDKSSLYKMVADRLRSELTGQGSPSSGGNPLSPGISGILAQGSDSLFGGQGGSQQGGSQPAFGGQSSSGGMDTAALAQMLLTGKAPNFRTVDGTTYSDTFMGSRELPGKGPTAQEQADITRESTVRQEYDLKQQEELNTAINDIEDTDVLHNKLLELQQKVMSNPDLFGHRWADSDRAKGTPFEFSKNTKNPVAGEITAALIPQIAAIDKALSDRGSNLAMNLGASKMPQFGDTHEVAIGKMKALVDESLSKNRKAKKRAGGNIVKIGNKRYIKLKNGDVMELTLTGGRRG